MKSFKLIALLASMALGIGCWSVSSWSASSKAKLTSALDEIAAQSGLVRMKKKNIDLVYRRPDASLSKYGKLLLLPVDVSFSKNFDPAANSILYKMNPPDRERIKTELGETFAKEFKRELQ